MITVEEDGTARWEDSQLLDRAGANRRMKRVLFTRDSDMLVETTRRLRSGEEFISDIYAHQLEVSIGRCEKRNS